MADDVDGAAEALAPIWNVPAEQRNTGIVVRAARIGRHLSQPMYHGAPLPRELRERIEDFTRVSPAYRLWPDRSMLGIEGRSKRGEGMCPLPWRDPVFRPPRGG